MAKNLVLAKTSSKANGTTPTVPKGNEAKRKAKQGKEVVNQNGGEKSLSHTAKTREHRRL